MRREKSAKERERRDKGDRGREGGRRRPPYVALFSLPPSLDFKPIP